MNWAVLLDVDGTMVDNRRFHEAAWIELGRRRGLSITPEYYRTRMHSRSNARIARLLLGDKVTPQEAAAMSDEKETIYRALYRPELRETPGLSALLSALADARVPCAAVSNSPPENVVMVLDTLGIRARFALVLDCTQVCRGKPDPELFLTASRGLGVAIENCLVLEDSVSGFAAAEAAGAPYVVIAAGADPEELRHARQAVAMVKDFTQLTVEQMARWARGNGRTESAGPAT